MSDIYIYIYITTPFLGIIFRRITDSDIISCKKNYIEETTKENVSCIIIVHSGISKLSLQY